MCNGPRNEFKLLKYLKFIALSLSKSINILCIQLIHTIPCCTTEFHFIDCNCNIQFMYDFRILGNYLLLNKNMFCCNETDTDTCPSIDRNCIREMFLSNN